MNKISICLSFEHFRSLSSQGYTLDVVFLLKAFNEGVDLNEISQDNRLAILHTTLLRKGLITKENKLTKEGKSVLDFLSSPAEMMVEKPIQKGTMMNDEDFNKWWNAYPSTDTFVHKGKKFVGTRALKAKKDECKLKLSKILAEGEYSLDELVRALEMEVGQKKDNSVKTNANKLSYMQSSITYLNQRTFEPFIELVNNVDVNSAQEEKTGGVDI